MLKLKTAEGVTIYIDPNAIDFMGVVTDPIFVRGNETYPTVVGIGTQHVYVTEKPDEIMKRAGRKVL